MKDISFNLSEGKFLGVIGSNGSGKSTLLRVLNNEISYDGKFETKGKLSLLQIGVGLNRQLSGLENIKYSLRLNGFSNVEIFKLVPKIIDFSELENFIYAPVKTYSSGMYSRLAFSIGIMIDPEILIVDEVLSVGDLRFSQKCLREIKRFKERGKTAIIVTHNLAAVENFCDEALWLEKGTIRAQGSPKDVVNAFRTFCNYNKTVISKTRGVTKKIVNESTDGLRFNSRKRSYLRA